jgi:AcrR family transcriptional regulator
VYHYFDSKDEVLDTLFLERWDLMLAMIADVDAREDQSPREKLHEVASFIFDSYRYDPELMKVIIVEVTRAANSFGRTHLAKIQEAYEGIGRIVESAQEEGKFHKGVSAEFAALAFYGAVEQVLTAWIFEVLPHGDDDFEQAKRFVVETVCSGLDVGRSD